MADIFHEVDEEVRRDQAVEFWKKHQTHAFLLAAVVVAGAGAWRYYQNALRDAAEQAGARYENALALARADNTAGADDAFKSIIASGPPGYAMLARFRSAQDISKADPVKAVAIYDGLANDASVDPAMRDIARLRAGILRVDTGDFSEVRTRLEPLAQSDGPFRDTAREFLAIAALKAGDADQAAKWFDAIVVDKQAPSETRSRAEALQGLVTAGKPKG